MSLKKNKDLEINVHDDVQSQAVFGNVGNKSSRNVSNTKERAGNRAYRRTLNKWKRKRNKFGEPTVY
jgi:hypothetical protein